jgi:hypothetical protein
MFFNIPSIGTHAQKYATNWTPSYGQKLVWKLKKFAGRVAEVTFGCRHRHITLPFDDHQTCLDCGASRLYLLNPEFYLSGITDAPIFMGLWKKVSQNVGRADVKSFFVDGTEHELFRPTDPGQMLPGDAYRITPDQTVSARANAVMDRATETAVR